MKFVLLNRNAMKKINIILKVISIALIITGLKSCANTKPNVDLNKEMKKTNSALSNNTLDAFYRKYIAAANARDFSTIATLINDNVMINGIQLKKEDAIAGIKWLTDVVPNYKWDIEDLFIDGERIAVRLRDTGTPAKTFFGNEPTGSSVDITEFASYKVHDGKFVEMWYLIDAEKIKAQLTK